MNVEDDTPWWDLNTFKKSVSMKEKTGCGNLYTLVVFEKDKPIRVQPQLGRSGGCAAAMLAVIGDLISDRLERGDTVEGAISIMRGVSCPSRTEEAPACVEALAKTLRSVIEVFDERISDQSSD